jgi:glycosyltransferase involved in cell wall biosynthesis
MPKPILSILLPAYDYCEGINRILKILFQDFPSSVEILVFDNSHGVDVMHEVKFWQQLNYKIYYRRNDPRTEPAVNWNDLIENARGDYCLLIHHDEFPISINFIKSILQYLQDDENIDVLILDCLLINKDGKYAQRQLPKIIRSWLVLNSASYLYKRNFIGPTAALIVRRTLYPKFDNKLRWLVDVDVYYQLSKNKLYWKIAKSVQIGSLQGRTDSITAVLKTNIKKILYEEKIYLSQKYPFVIRWLQKDLNWFIKYLELILWFLIRIFTIACSRLLWVTGFSKMLNDLIKGVFK